MGNLTMNALQLRTALELAASSADLSADTAIMVGWDTSKNVIVCPIETIATYLRETGINPDTHADTFAALGRWGRHYCRIVNYKPAPRTPEFAAARGIVADTYTPPKRQRAARAATVADTVATADTAVAGESNPFDAVTFADNPPHVADTETVTAPVGKRAKRRAKRGEFRDAAVTGNPADFAAE